MTRFRSFGIELECFHPVWDASVSTQKIIAAITAMGYRAKASGYTGRDYDVWQVKPDGSLTPYGKALELVAPTLPGNEASFEQVRKVVEWMSAQGFDVNRSCGFHVHINTKDLTVAEQAAVSYRYHLNRDAINAVLPPSRHSGSYCAALGSREVSKVRSALVDHNATTIWSHDERRVAVNLEHATKGMSGRRIEFRQHSGTLNYGKIFGWYRMLCDFIEVTVALHRAGVTAPAPQPVVPVSGSTHVARLRRADQRTYSLRVATTPAGTVPYIEPGSDYDKFLQAIEQDGVVTQQHGRTFGWPETRLRVTAHWLRRRGAALVTTERNGELAYVARNGVRDRAAMFVNEGEVRERLPVGAVPPVERTVRQMTAASPAVAPVDRVSVLSAPFEQGLSAETLTWYRQRREDFGNT